MSYLQKNELQNWLPWRLLNDTTGTLCQWLYTDNKSFTEPFFDDTILDCKNLAQNCKPYRIVSDVQMIEEWADTMQTIAPTAIIFHVSRCGSTLLSQLLSTDETNIVLSEVPFFDEILRLPYKKQSAKSIVSNNFLKAAIKFYSRPRTGKESHVFVKTDSWHLHFYDQFRALFPSIPFVFLYRNPIEVIISQQLQRGMHSVPGIIEPAVFGFSKREINESTLDEYLANVLAGYFNKMIEIAKLDPLVLPVNYREGMSSIMKKMYDFLGIDMMKETEKLLKERSRFHAKYPQELFNEENKEFATPGYLLPASDLYTELEQIRIHKY